jgi:hypothetical protein
VSQGFEESRLEWRRSRLVAGLTAESFVVPIGLVVETSPEALRFRGPADAVIALQGEFAKLERSLPGAEAHVDDWTLRVSDEKYADLEPEADVISLPWHAWGMVGSLFSDVAYEYESNPFDFSEVGYIVVLGDEGQKLPWPRPDIGVIVEAPLYGRTS